MSMTLHHIGILVADIAPAAEQYGRRFGCKIISDVIHDPVQTARVRFLSWSGAAPYIELVTPDGPNSKLSNALKKGGGLNHLCHLCPDIEDTCRRLREEGMFLLQSPVMAAAFPGRRIAWLMGRDGLPVELLEPGEGL
jgi:methylmalonyl-CoA/ethylmalonyl-CoA epimerase